jgi:hypothetical protein
MAELSPLRRRMIEDMTIRNMELWRKVGDDGVIGAA